jgi:hypothetical protein
MLSAVSTEDDAEDATLSCTDPDDGQTKDKFTVVASVCAESTCDASTLDEPSKTSNVRLELPPVYIIDPRHD